MPPQQPLLLAAIGVWHCSAWRAPPTTTPTLPHTLAFPSCAGQEPQRRAINESLRSFCQAAGDCRLHYSASGEDLSYELFPGAWWRRGLGRC